MSERREYIPREYGPLATGFMLENKRCSLFAGMGLGKSVMTLTALDILYSFGEESAPTLVLAPLRVARTTWGNEARKWAHLRQIDVSPIVGDPEERAAALRKDVSVYTINYENIPWLVAHLAEHGRVWPFEIVVADESTKLKSLRISMQTSSTGKQFLRTGGGGVRAKALGEIAFKHVKRWVNLTGTPSPNGLQDLWGQTWFIDQGARLGRSFDAFKRRWFFTAPGDYQSKPIALPHAQGEIQERLHDICLTLRAEDYFDLEAPIVRTIAVELSAKARRTYQDMEKRMFMELEGYEVEAFNAASKTIKCLQLANGAAYVDEDVRDDNDPRARKFVEVHDEKLQALESIVEEAAGMPVLVVYQFKSDLARLLKAFPNGRKFDANPQTLQDFAAKKIPVLFIHPASGGHGVDGLQDGTNVIAFFGLWWNLEEYQQVIERIGPVRQMQSGHKRAVFIYHIVCAGTVDELVLERLETKAEVQDILLNAMKRRKAA